ncbi:MULTISPECIES: mandelate racemase/muconate lactonizing enzyme family protein [Microbacterium]|uniref:Mandelate racemase/muconate lactonizing enzyme family protein n=1 Tax=Microbacterium wangchenii TaxID=2541726 RepID=A0ABX5SYV2_9MICO|nr:MULTISPECIES: mandelate racemase/muconate lactonizing enzyme family protein [Microbacterium]MCK6068447.1 mandelate racemase/muconate lactonizing enzyme family protein [Microbacterium sp. EYE_512]QBR90005.1 mandelate racemase/muconate lactonizing enzyme family protein [Microbacterium wangchenii]TFV85144.1 mandelate racemase/muconate lactonizing enzyme family protein [Microbacterium sp. dk485]TXK09275.1 mandelate racemase/muconate lactonizing enzyme family protein [Microbacterium wangchenii]
MKITAVETIYPGARSAMPALVFVRIHTDEGIQGIGDTFYLPQTCISLIHEHIAPVLLGQDALAIERHWRDLYRAYARFGGRGAEIRALSAVDVALWDILGKASGQPVHRLLGTAQESIPTYNTCGGPLYASVEGGSQAGYGSSRVAGMWDDFDAFLNRPGELAQDLVSEGAKGMKIWPFDRFAQAKGSRAIEAGDLEAGLSTVAAIRDAVGDAIEIMVDGHGLWDLTPAMRIAKGLEQYDLAWAEDLTLADNPRTLARLRASSRTPISVSEYLVTRQEYMPILEQDAADLIMIDPTWAGGITESRKIAVLADTFGLPVTYHDCTGPLTLLAGIHLSAATPNLRYQESVRAYLRSVYPTMVTYVPEVTDGTFALPTAPGLGTELSPEFLAGEDVVVRTTRLES